MDDQQTERTPSMSEILGNFLCPLPYTLPEAIRKSIRELVEYQDIEWATRHPNCIRHQWQQADDRGKWGDECLACFSNVSAIETIGQLETVIALHHALRRYNITTDSSLEVFSRQLANLLSEFDQLLLQHWHRLFFERQHLGETLPALLRLREHLVQLDTANEGSANNAHHLPATVKQNLPLIRLLAEILARGGMRCFMVHSELKDIFSPGMEILLLCLTECSVNVNAVDIEAILMDNREDLSCQR